MSGAGERRPRRRRLLLVAFVAAAVIAVDQITKSIAVSELSRGRDIDLVGPVGFRLEYNSGIAFSLGTSLTGPIIVVVALVVIGIAWASRRVPTTLAAVGVGLVLGGALGNLSDRLFRGHHGAVVDFLYTRYWPTFNVADACIVCGCIMLAWTYIWRSRHARPSDSR